MRSPAKSIFSKVRNSRLVTGFQERKSGRHTRVGRAAGHLGSRRREGAQGKKPGGAISRIQCPGKIKRSKFKERIVVSQGPVLQEIKQVKI